MNAPAFGSVSSSSLDDSVNVPHVDAVVFLTYYEISEWDLSSVKVFSLHILTVQIMLTLVNHLVPKTWESKAQAEKYQNYPVTAVTFKILAQEYVCICLQ